MFGNVELDKEVLEAAEKIAKSAGKTIKELITALIKEEGRKSGIEWDWSRMEFSGRK